MAKLGIIGLISLVASSLLAAERPNVVIIYGDDVGYGDVGAYGSTLIPTPHLDRLAAEGLLFLDGHCTAATCTPSRYSLLTGVHGFRNGIRILAPNAPLTVPTDALTLPKVFKQAGYTTAVVGKWHLGLGEDGVPVDWNGAVKPGPLEVGFDYSFLLPSTNDRVPCVYLENHHVVNLDPADPLFVGRGRSKPEAPESTVYPDGQEDRSAMTYYQSSHGHDNSVINGIGRIGYMAGGKSALWDDETMADVFVEKARAFITSHKKEPFFLFFSSQDIHVPRTPHPRFKGVSELGYRGDAMVQLDWSTGQILQVLDELGQGENTIVIFSSDNGPVYDDGYVDGTTVKTSTGEVDRGHDGSGIYRGGKYQIFEGGTRVPFIIRWPARIEPGNSEALVSQIDLLASFASLLSVDLQTGQAADSRDTLDAFLGQDETGLDFLIEEAGRRVAIRSGHWKYIPPAKGQTRPDRGARPGAALYDLSSDPGESHNLADRLPDRAQALHLQLQPLLEGQPLRP
jgi:arylsulfatase A-like enzyme